MRYLTVLSAYLLPCLAAHAQSVPVLKYDPPANFSRSAITPPEDYSSNEVNASIQIYPFQPFSGDLQQQFQQTLMRDWIDPRHRETNVAALPTFSVETMPGAQVVYSARFVETIAGLP